MPSSSADADLHHWGERLLSLVYAAQDPFSEAPTVVVDPDWNEVVAGVATALNEGASPHLEVRPNPHLPPHRGPGGPTASAAVRYPPLLSRLHGARVAVPEAVGQAFIAQGALDDEEIWSDLLPIEPALAHQVLLHQRPLKPGRYSDPFYTLVGAYEVPSPQRALLWEAALAHPQATAWKDHFRHSDALHRYVKYANYEAGVRPSDMEDWLDRIHAMGVSWETKLEWNETALAHRSAGLDDEILVRIALVRKGADPNACDCQKTPILITAVNDRQADLVDALLLAGADVNQPDANGATALHHATANHNTSLVQRLIASGADLSARNRYQMTALEQLIDHDFLNLSDFKYAPAALRTIVEQLIHAGADVDAVSVNHGLGRAPLLSYFEEVPSIRDWLSEVLHSRHLKETLEATLPAAEAPSSRPRPRL